MHGRTEDGSTSRDRHSAGRREFLKRAGLSATTLAGCSDWLARLALAADAPTVSAWPATLKMPEKTELLLQSDRPPNLETPLKYFREDLTPNEAFYVRWHLSVLPTRIDPATFRLTVGGHVALPLSLSLDDLRRNFEPASVIAVNQCSGNSRSKYAPRMPGVQWGNGAIGNAKWTGVRLSDILKKAGLKAGAVDVTFNGLDGPTLPAAPGFAGTPDFVKSLAVDHANDGEVMVAYEMNGQPLPMLNGFPLRLVVPGWYATYWVKALNELTVLDKPFDGFWMAKAYRVPNTPGFQEKPDALAKETVPISRMSLRSLFVRPEPTETIAGGVEYEVQGLAIDGGHGMKSIEVSTDAGATWAAARFDAELGKYSWRRWRFAWKPKAGKHVLMARATNLAGQNQVASQWNRSGYARNVIESVEVNAV